MTFAAALGDYIAARSEYERLGALADAAFIRWFTRANDGGPRTNGAAASRAANRESMASAELESAEIALYAAADREGFDTNPDGEDYYRSANEARVAKHLYAIAVLEERHGADVPQGHSRPRAGRRMSAKTLPRLLNRKALAEELGITLSAAEAIMRAVPRSTQCR